jgi:hypothetical protein
LNFVTTKNLHIVEVHTFNTLSGTIGANGVARVSVDLNSINSGVVLRDQRMREMLFETATHPTATIEVAVPVALLNSLSAGQSTQADITANVNLHGSQKSVSARVLIQRLSNSRVLVQSLSPPLARAADFNLVEGVERLRSVVNLVSISTTVPVDFAFAFDAR